MTRGGHQLCWWLNMSCAHHVTCTQGRTCCARNTCMMRHMFTAHVLSNICSAFTSQLAHAPLFEGRAPCLLCHSCCLLSTPMLSLVHAQLCPTVQIYRPIAGAAERVTGAGVRAPGGAPESPPVSHSHQVGRGDTWSLLVSDTSAFQNLDLICNLAFKPALC